MDDGSTIDVLIECVKAAGGSKVVGHRIFPEKMVDAAQRHLLNCLSDGRSERLTPDQVMLVARLARERGCHAYAHHVAAELGYAEPIPIEPKDELADLLRRHVEETAEANKRQERIEQLLTSMQQRQTLRAA
jgi:hypothetical protein